jgi:hypothetical protein
MARLLGDFSWASNMYGRYLMQDHGSAVLKVRDRVMAVPELRDYMLQAWSPILLPEAHPETLARFSPSGAGDPSVGAATQLSYGLDRIEYEVALLRDTLLVENELYFPGWTAELEGPGIRTSLEARPVAGALRSWSLPRGRYRMTARFATPTKAGFRLVTVAAIALWLGLLLASCLRDTVSMSRDLWDRLVRVRFPRVGTGASPDGGPPGPGEQRDSGEQ